MKSFTIKELEKYSGIKAHTLRIWEFRYKTIKPSRTNGNFRMYSLDDVRMVLNLALLNKNGISISALIKMNPEQKKKNLDALDGKENNARKTFNELLVYMYAMNIDMFEIVLDRYIALCGFERAIKEVIIPFLEQTDLLESKHRNPEECLAVSMIRLKLMMGIENIIFASNTTFTVLMFLPEGSCYDLLLLYQCYLLKIQGIKVVYLGVNVSSRIILSAARRIRPEFLLTCVLQKHKFPMRELLAALNKELPETSLIISGTSADNYKNESFNGLTIAPYHQVHDILLSLREVVCNL